MVQDLLIHTYVYRHATPFIDDRAFAAVPDMHLFDAVGVFADSLALWTPVFQKPSVDAQVLVDETFSRGQTFERLRIMGSQRPK